MSVSDSARLIERELQLHDRAMGASSCGITIADMSLPDIPLIYINDAFERITGYATSEVRDQNCRFLQGDDRDQPERALIRDALQKGEDCTVVMRNYHKDGTLFWNELFLSPVHSDRGALTHFVGVQTDVTERKNAEAELLRRQTALENALHELGETQAMLIHSEKMNALGQMVAGIAHEINNPISFVNSNLHSLKDSLNDIVNAYSQLEALIHAEGTTGQKEMMKAIRRDADLDFTLTDVRDMTTDSLTGLNRVKGIIESLRTFSRLDEAQMKTINLVETIKSTLAVLGTELKKRNVTVQLELDSLPEFRCFPAELNQAFLNLIMNAAQAIESDGTITIRGFDRGDDIELQFSDTGTGIPPEIQDKLFNPFFTTKPVGMGTGLGLTIVYKIITDMHGGAIRVDSTVGSGSTFTLTLPKERR